jgi:hypothetical protein
MPLKQQQQQQQQQQEAEKAEKAKFLAKQKEEAGGPEFWVCCQ